MATDSTFGKVVEVAESAITSTKVSDLQHGDVILVPGKGKRGVRVHSNGKVSLVFPRSGAPKVDGKSAGSLADLGQHDPAVIGYVKGGWGLAVTNESEAKPRKATTKASTTSTKRPAKGSAEAKERMAAVRAARGNGATKQSSPKASPSSNATHFTAALESLADAIDHLRQVTVA